MTASSVTQSATLAANASDRFARLFEIEGGHQVLLMIDVDGDKRVVTTTTSVAGLQISEKVTVSLKGPEEEEHELDKRCVEWMNNFTQERADKFFADALNLLTDGEGDDDGA